MIAEQKRMVICASIGRMARLYERIQKRATVYWKLRIRRLDISINDRVRYAVIAFVASGVPGSNPV